MFKVLPPGSAVYKSQTDASFYLVQDLWNDYNYQTLYHLYLSAKHTEDGESVLFGSVKILKKGQTKQDSLQLGLGFFESLNDKYCSLGQSLDYYERVAQLDKDLQQKLLNALRDIVITPEYLIGFEDEGGFRESLLRGFDQSDDIFKIAPMLITKDFHSLPSIELKFEFKVAGMVQPIIFDFDAPKYGPNSDSMPNRVAVMIGKNGSGKSSFLAKLSKIVFASTSDRKHLTVQKIGNISPVGLGFPRIINLSYSAFDSFQIPGLYVQEKEQIGRDIEKGVGRYIFCGIRDITKELEDHLKSLKPEQGGKLSDVDILEDKQKNTFLKTIKELSTEFELNISAIRSLGRLQLLTEAFSILFEEASMAQILNNNILSFDEAQMINWFSNLSTGHKFVLHSTSSIVRYIEARTLLLFDEPETHLHPPLLAVLMKTIRHLLNKMNGFMVVATHSPVVVQETLSKHVYIVRREGTETDISKPKIQTYGENIGLITSHIFGLSTDITDYHSVLENIVSSFLWRNENVDRDKVLSDIEKLFDGEMSMQARAFVLSKLYKKLG